MFWNVSPYSLLFIFVHFYVHIPTGVREGRNIPKDKGEESNLPGGDLVRLLKPTLNQLSHATPLNVYIRGFISIILLIYPQVDIISLWAQLKVVKYTYNYIYMS